MDGIGAKFKYLNDGDPWMLGEDIPDIDFFFSQIWVTCFVREFSNIIGRSYRKVLVIFRGGYHLWFYYGEKDSNEVGQHIVNLFLKDPTFADKVNVGIMKQSDVLTKFAKTLPENDLEKLSNEKLWYYYKRHDRLHTAYYTWGWIPVAVDMFHGNLTNTLKKYLVSQKISDEKSNEYFTLLTQSSQPSLIQEEQLEFLRIAKAIETSPIQKKLFKDLYYVFEEQDVAPYGLGTHTPEYEAQLEKRARSIRSKIQPRIMKMIEKYYQQNFFMKHMWIGKDGVTSFDSYLKELVKFVGRNGDAMLSLKEKEQELREMVRKRSTLISKLNITGKWKILFDAFGGFMITKIYRRYAQIYLIYRMQPILKEIARRFHLSIMEVRFMLTREVESALLHGKIDRDELKRRTQFCVYYIEKDRTEMFTGVGAEKLAAKAEKQKVEVVEEFRGQVACLGKAKGRVKIIIRPSDMTKMREGDILVSIATDPDIVTAMKKAAAIVTEQGGVTSHAAIVSRELNIPCVIGTKIATRVLHDGDLIDVDAEKGIIKVLERA